MSKNILVINCGSSSIKFSLADPLSGKHLLSGLAEKLGTADAALEWKGVDSGSKALGHADHRQALLGIVSLLQTLNLRCDGIGHRVVHGGEKFSQSCRVTDASLSALKANSHLAPLHNPVNMQGIEAAREAFPGLPQVMVFDTAFHQSMPRQAYLYALPYELYEQEGIRRYGFHGTSHRYVCTEAAKRLNRPIEELALISAHLGNGCSATAVLGGKSVDTTMGLTPLEGLVMGTRSGDIDPSLHEFLGNTLNLSLSEVSNLLNKKSGLLGLSGQSNDMRALLEAEAGGDERAAIAIQVFVYRLAKSIAALTVALGRLDALIFTGGIGENSIPVRERTLELLPFLQLQADAEANEIHGRDNQGIITLGTQPCAMVIRTDEEIVIARDTHQLICGEKNP
ncbi:acetate kinase [Kiritimatiellaeota bacterium B1221]|nr:acetate kinase [Kiritimatiellaeota bacterium B1221]